jgi:hypothetical protein
MADNLVIGDYLATNMSKSADNISKRSATSPTRTGTPNGKTPPRSFSPAPVINPALEAVRQMSEAKLKGAEPKVSSPIVDCFPIDKR